MGGRRKRRGRPGRRQTVAGTPPASPVERQPRSRWRPGYWLRHPAFSAFLLLCGALTMLNCGVGALVDRGHLRERGVTTTAVVEWVSVSQRRSWMGVRFNTPEGRTVNGTTGEVPKPRPARGDVLTVVYDPADPEDAYLPGGGPSLAGAAFLITLGVVAGGLCGWYLWATWSYWRDQAEDWRHHRLVPPLGERQYPWPARERPRTGPARTARRRVRPGRSS